MTAPLFYSNLTSLLALASSLIAAPLDTKTLTEVAARHGVPLPPNEARLVLAHGATWINLTPPSTSHEPAIYTPAFLLEEKTDGGVVVLRGMERRTVERRHNREPLCRAFSLEKVEPTVGGYAVNFEDRADFVCAVQLAARGDLARAQALWQSFAQGLWRYFAVASLWSTKELADEIDRQRKNPALLLAECIFDHQEHRLLEEPE